VYLQVNLYTSERLPLVKQEARKSGDALTEQVSTSAGVAGPHVVAGRQVGQHKVGSHVVEAVGGAAVVVPGLHVHDGRGLQHEVKVDVVPRVHVRRQWQPVDAGYGRDEVAVTGAVRGTNVGDVIREVEAVGGIQAGLGGREVTCVRHLGPGRRRHHRTAAARHWNTHTTHVHMN